MVIGRYANPGGEGFGRFFFFENCCFIWFFVKKESKCTCRSLTFLFFIFFIYSRAPKNFDSLPDPFHSTSTWSYEVVSHNSILQKKGGGWWFFLALWDGISSHWLSYHFPIAKNTFRFAFHCVLNATIASTRTFANLGKSTKNKLVHKRGNL